MTKGKKKAFQGCNALLLGRISQMLTTRLGLHISEERWSELAQDLGRAGRALGFDDLEAFGRWLLATTLTKNHLETLANFLTIGETYFLRDPDTMEVIAREILPGLISRRRAEQRLRLWSAGCSTGEEAYSLAMLLDQERPAVDSWDLSILATDISRKALDTARAGIYGEWSFRGTPKGVRHSHFSLVGPRLYALVPRLKEMVRFACLNLAEDLFPSTLNNTEAMDLILCRNVLMYWSAPMQEKLLDRLHRALTPDGWLVVSPPEAHLVSRAGMFAPARNNPCFFYKQGHEAPDIVSFYNTRAAGELPTGLDPVEDEPEDALALGDKSPPALPRDEAAKKTPGTLSHDDAYARALVYYEQGRYPEAIIEIMPGDTKALAPSTDACALLARCFANQGDLAEARAWCEKALVQGKLRTYLHYLHAVIALETGDTDEAIQALKRCLYIDQDFLMAHFTLGAVLLRRENARESRRHLSIARELLKTRASDEVVADGLTAGRLTETVEMMLMKET